MNGCVWRESFARAAAASACEARRNAVGQQLPGRARTRAGSTGCCCQRAVAPGGRIANTQGSATLARNV